MKIIATWWGVSLNPGNLSPVPGHIVESLSSSQPPSHITRPPTRFGSRAAPCPASSGHSIVRALLGWGCGTTQSKDKQTLTSFWGQMTGKTWILARFQLCSFAEMENEGKVRLTCFLRKPLISFPHMSRQKSQENRNIGNRAPLWLLVNSLYSLSTLEPAQVLMGSAAYL